jgi:hypothetical protein
MNKKRVIKLNKIKFEFQCRLWDNGITLYFKSENKKELIFGYKDNKFIIKNDETIIEKDKKRLQKYVDKNLHRGYMWSNDNIVKTLQDKFMICAMKKVIKIKENELKGENNEIRN